MHRCLLFAPGGRPELMEKAHRSGADALIFDLEDSVSADGKDQARQHIAQALQRGAGLPVYVRVHDFHSDNLDADLAALAPVAGSSLLEGIVLPKADCAAAVAGLDLRLADLERRARRREGSLLIVPLIEDCRGLRNAFEIASASPRVAGMSLASAEQGDLMADLGGCWTPESRALLYGRGKVVCDSRAAGIDWLIDGAFMNLKDDAALRKESALARELGFVAKMAIHPNQVPAIRATYSPSVQQVELARELIAAFRAAAAEGRGAVTYRGMMIDHANVRAAQRVLALAGES